MADIIYKLDLSEKFSSVEPMNWQCTPKGAIASWTAAVICRFQSSHAFQKRQRTGALQNLAVVGGPIRGKKVLEIIEACFDVYKLRSMDRIMTFSCISWFKNE